MSNDPVSISLDKVADLLRGLGLDPVEMEHLKSIRMEGGTIEVVRYRHDEQGRWVDADNDVLTETVTIKLAS